MIDKSACINLNSSDSVKVYAISSRQKSCLGLNALAFGGNCVPCGLANFFGYAPFVGFGTAVYEMFTPIK